MIRVARREDVNLSEPSDDSANQAREHGLRRCRRGNDLLYIGDPGQCVSANDPTLMSLRRRGTIQKGIHPGFKIAPKGDASPPFCALKGINLDGAGHDDSMLREVLHRIGEVIFDDPVERLEVSISELNWSRLDGTKPVPEGSHCAPAIISVCVRGLRERSRVRCYRDHLR